MPVKATRKILSLLLAFAIFLCNVGALAVETAEGQQSASSNAEQIVVDVPATLDDYAVTDGLPENWINILLLGTDVRDTTSYGRTDSMIVLSVNLSTKEAKLTSFMRDIWVDIEGHGEAKLNSACVYGGPDLIMSTINENFGLNLKYYALVNLNCMADIIDMLGGIRLDVTEAERDALNKGLFDLSSMSGMEKLEDYGEQVLLNGNQAVAFARIRLIDSDYRRTERQRTVLTTIAKRLQEENAITLVGVITNMLQYVETNMSLTQVMTLANVGLQMNMDAIEEFRIPADNTYEAGTFDGVWCIKPNFSENTKLLKEFIYG